MWHHKLIIWLVILVIPLALWAAVATVLRPKKLSHLYRNHFANARRERLFLSTASFFIAFATARTIAAGVHLGHVGICVIIGPVHVHHLVFGILILLVVGWVWLMQIGTGREEPSRWPSRITAVLYGIGAALTLDEFALWLNLADVYWAREGRESIDAIIAFASAMMFSLLGANLFRAIIQDLARVFRLMPQSKAKKPDTSRRGGKEPSENII